MKMLLNDQYNIIIYNINIIRRTTLITSVISSFYDTRDNNNMFYVVIFRVNKLCEIFKTPYVLPTRRRGGGCGTAAGGRRPTTHHNNIIIILIAEYNILTTKTISLHLYNFVLLLLSSSRVPQI